MPPSPPSQTVMALLWQLGYDDITIESIQMQDTKTPEFLKLNPKGQIPTLKDGDYGLGESAAIQ